MAARVTRRLCVPAIGLLCVGLSGGACTPAREFDLIIRGGTVYDGSGDPARVRVADVGITGDRIIAVARLDGRRAGQVIDASGKAVSPGFVDVLGQSGATLLGDGTGDSHVRQGITTEILGENSPAFWSPDTADVPLLRRYGLTLSWTGLRGYFDVLDGRGTSLNVGTLVPMPPTGDAAAAVAAGGRAIADGALGIWLGAAADTAPDRGMLTALARLAAGFDVPLVTVPSSTPPLPEQAAALAALSQQTHVPVMLARFGGHSAPGWGPLALAARPIIEAEDRGVDVSVAARPYPRRVPPAPEDEADARAAMDMRRDMTYGTDTAAAVPGSPLGPLSRHPAAFGLFPRVLGRYVREHHAQEWAVAIRRMTAFPATLFRLDRRGQIREGYFADVVVFDPATVIDRATFENPAQYPVGIEYVIVNGVITAGPNGHTGARPGRRLLSVAARRPPS